MSLSLEVLHQMPSKTLRDHTSREISLIMAYYQNKAEDKAREDHEQEWQREVARRRKNAGRR